MSTETTSSPSIKNRGWTVTAAGLGIGAAALLIAAFLFLKK